MYITDGDNELLIYGLYDLEDNRFDAIENKPIVGDTIEVYVKLNKYNDIVQLKDAKLTRVFVVEDEGFDISQYEEVTLLEARNKDVDTKVLVQGVVARITNANGFKPNGVIIVDGSHSLYVYSNDVASSVSEGDLIQVAASRANFILADEVSQAEKHGYEGAIQVDRATLVKKISSKQELDLTWVTSKTIKELMETSPRDENITGSIFKVNAFINKVPGGGFTNYYFNDLDNTTGSYTYSMNNGNDFTWLDQYDGQLRTVYLSVINAKATPSGIQYRLVPVLVGDEFTYDQSYNAEFAVKYFGVDQFEKEYFKGYSPDLELVTNISSEKLGIVNVPITYTSSNSSVVNVVSEGGKFIFKTFGIGTATITIKATDEFGTYEQAIEIKVVEAVELDTLDIKDAIAKEDETEVIVEGVVAASLVNQSGFYLIDETGIVAVRVAADELKNVELGNKVVLKGMKRHVRGSFEPSQSLGQLVIDQAVIEQNLKGNHEYDTSNFVKDKTLSDFINLDKLEEHSTTVGIIVATIEYVETPFFTSYKIVDGEGNSMNIYSSNGSQLSFLEPFQNKEVTIEFTVVNWNGKNYTGSILSATDGVTKVVSNQNFK